MVHAYIITHKITKESTALHFCNVCAFFLRVNTSLSVSKIHSDEKCMGCTHKVAPVASGKPSNYKQ